MLLYLNLKDKQLSPLSGYSRSIETLSQHFTSRRWLWDVEPERLIPHPAALTNETQQEHEECDTVPSYSLINYVRRLVTFLA